MANAMSSVSDMAQEVATLLGFDNIDSRIYQWLGMTYNEILQRQPVDLFYTCNKYTVANERHSIALPENIGTPTAAIFSNDDTVYAAQYVSENDFDRKVATGAVMPQSTIPRYWTIRKYASTQSFCIYPMADGATDVYLIWLGNYLTAPPVAADYLSIPYHYEHILIWGAAAQGSQVLRLNSYAFFTSEFEEMLNELYQLQGYKPSSTPVRKSITGPYEGTHRMAGAPRFPQNING